MDGDFDLTIQKSDRPQAGWGWRLAEGLVLVLLVYALGSNHWLLAAGAAVALVAIYRLWRWRNPGAGTRSAGTAGDADSGGD